MKYFFIIPLFCLLPFKASGQNIDKLVWFGVDFSAAKFILVPENPSDIVSRHLPAINYVILAEPGKYDIMRYFNAGEVVINTNAVTAKNASIDPSGLIANTNQKISAGVPEAMVREYDSEEKDGTGLVFIAENLNKATESATFIVCLFDVRSRDVISIRRMTGRANGFGFRNHWAYPVYQVMKDWGTINGNVKP